MSFYQQTCRSCIDQLKLPWDNAKDKKDQPRYLLNQNCIMWKMFEGLNDWRIVETSAMSNNGRDSKQVKSTILRKRQLHISSLIKIRDTATYAVNNKNSNGF